MTQWNERGISKACKDVEKWLPKESKEMARHVVEEVLENYISAGGICTPQPELRAVRDALEYIRSEQVDIHNHTHPVHDRGTWWRSKSCIEECDKALTKLTALINNNQKD